VKLIVNSLVVNKKKIRVHQASKEEEEEEQQEEEQQNTKVDVKKRGLDVL